MDKKCQALHCVRVEKQRSVLYEFIVDRAGVAKNCSPLRYPLVCGRRALDLEFFISLCGLICLRGGKVPRCGLAPIFARVWVLDLFGGNRAKAKNSSRVTQSTHKHTNTLTHNVLLCVPHCAVVYTGTVHTFSLIHSLLQKTDTRREKKILAIKKKKKKKSRDRKKTGVKRGTRLKLTKKRRVDVPEFHLPVYQSPEDVS